MAIILVKNLSQDDHGDQNQESGGSQPVILGKMLITSAIPLAT